MSAKQQLDVGNALSTPPAIFDYSNASYLKQAITKWPSCAPPTGGSSSFVAVNLEAKAISRNPDAGTVTPLTDISQGSTNMCSAFAFAQGYTVKFALQTPNGIIPQLSPVYAYYLQRVEECSTTGVCPCPTCPTDTCASKCDPPCVDCGSYLLSAGSIYGTGVCTSTDWPLSTPMNANPTPAARLKSKNQRVSSLECVPVDSSLANSLMVHLSKEHPIIVFLNITDANLKWMQALVDSSTSDTTPAISSPSVQFPYVAGDAVTSGHVVCVVGYDAASDAFIIRNSYGFKWGAQGRFTILRKHATSALIHEASAIVSVL